MNIQDGLKSLADKSERIAEELIDKHGLEHALDVAALESKRVDPAAFRDVGLDAVREALREDRGWLMRLLALREFRRKAESRLEYLRGEIHAERISYSELAELQSLAEHIDPGDTLLLEWAGVPEFEEDEV